MVSMFSITVNTITRASVYSCADNTGLAQLWVLFGAELRRIGDYPQFLRVIPRMF